MSVITAKWDGSSSLLRPSNLHDYQLRAINHMIQQPQTMLWLDMGLGKTISALTAFMEQGRRLNVWGTLIVAPLRVCQTVWAQEAAAWSHTQGLRFSLINGTASERHRAMRVRADFYLLNYENVDWFVEELVKVYLSKGKYPPFNALIADEITKFKDSTTGRHLALQKILPYIPYRTGLTGTPAPKGYKDLFGQYLAIDSGVRLGTDLSAYKKQFFDNKGYGYEKLEIKEGVQEYIHQQIADITIEMRAEDYLKMPKVSTHDIIIDLPASKMQEYKALEKELFLSLPHGISVEIFNASAVTNKCLQYANGALYYTDDRTEFAEVHDEKLKVLDDIVEEASGTPILLCYEFRHDRARILKRYKGAEVIDSTLNTDEVRDLVQRWNRGEIPLLIGHPQSMGHGLNLQKGGHIFVWFGLNWSIELYLQALARLNRQGQQYPITVLRILANNTQDMIVKETLEVDEAIQTALRDAIRAMTDPNVSQHERIELQNNAALLEAQRPARFLEIVEKYKKVSGFA